MNENPIKPMHVATTEFDGEMQCFSGYPVSLSDPSVESRVRKGQPQHQGQENVSLRNLLDDSSPTNQE